MLSGTVRRLKGGLTSLGVVGGSTWKVVAIRLCSSAQSSNITPMEQVYSDTRDYLVVRYPSTAFDSQLADMGYGWINKCYHNFYQTYHKEWDKSTAVLLEVGGGPCIYPLISAAPYVSEIYHSDYVKAFRDEVLMWKNKDPNAYDWSPYFKHIVQTLEGQTNPEAVAEQQEKLRSLLKVVPCDLKADVVVPAIKRPVNIISSNYCLESSFNSLEYSAAVKKFMIC
ncbi:indolethylamine N-methyltransferase-like [Dysidea avara]|uniref:indolethylamine N-methyltransferase-like n=1 Tax=Dysidea avara TaxID=196820 RepID=UPI00332E7FAC